MDHRFSRCHSVSIHKLTGASGIASKWSSTALTLVSGLEEKYQEPFSRLLWNMYDKNQADPQGHVCYEKKNVYEADTFTYVKATAK